MGRIKDEAGREALREMLRKERLADLFQAWDDHSSLDEKAARICLSVIPEPGYIKDAVRKGGPPI